VRAKHLNFVAMASYKTIITERINQGDIYEGREYEVTVTGKDFTGATVSCPFYYKDKTLALELAPEPTIPALGQVKFIVALTAEQTAALKGDVTGRASVTLGAWRKTPIKINLTLIKIP
jgi:hypothetical protein